MRWGVPLVHSMHTLAKVKNAALAEGDAPEPLGRVLGEQRVVDSADRLIANTADEADAAPSRSTTPARSRWTTVLPGVDLTTFTRRPGEMSPYGWRAAASACPRTGHVLLFVGRIQPLKAPDVLLRAAAAMLRARAAAARPARSSPSWAGRAVRAVRARTNWSGSRRGWASPTSYASSRPCPQAELADWYRAADVTVVPSHSESFGLVAVESQACGTPVVAAAVGGLRTAVRDGESGVLVEGHDPAAYARVLLGLLSAPHRLRAMARAAVRHGAAFGWDATVDRLLEIYTAAVSERAMAASA